MQITESDPSTSYSLPNYGFTFTTDMSSVTVNQLAAANQNEMNGIISGSESYPTKSFSTSVNGPSLLHV